MRADKIGQRVTSAPAFRGGKLFIRPGYSCASHRVEARRGRTLFTLVGADIARAAARPTTAATDNADPPTMRAPLQVARLGEWNSMREAGQKREIRTASGKRSMMNPTGSMQPRRRPSVKRFHSQILLVDAL